LLFVVHSILVLEVDYVEKKVLEVETGNISLSQFSEFGFLQVAGEEERAGAPE